jgi:hypothetical protein
MIKMCMSAILLSRWLVRAAQAAVPLAMAACAQPASTAATAISPIPPGEARLWFYRDYEPYAGKGTPAVATNGVNAGIAELGGAFYRDLPPGAYHVTVETYGTDINQSTNVDLAAGQEAYVKIVSLPSLASDGDIHSFERPTFYAWRIPSDVARAQVARLAFHGGS